MNKQFMLLLASGLFTLSLASEQESVAISTAQFNKVDAKTDVLGRHNPKVRNTPKSYAKPVSSVKALAKTNAYFDNEIAIEARSGAYINDKSNNYGREYFLNQNNQTASTSDKVSESMYNSIVDNIERYDNVRLLYKQTRPSSYSKLSNNHYTVDFFKSGCYGKSECTIKDLLYFKEENIYRNSNLYSSALQQNIKGNGIGIYFVEKALPIDQAVQKLVENNNNVSFYTVKGNCIFSTSRGTPLIEAGSAAHGTSVLRTLHYAAPKAKIYGYTLSCTTNNQKAAPADPFYDNIFIGTHSYGSGSDFYDAESEDIDNYIYNTRVVEFASAGNSGLSSSSQISATARGVNVISVGAVDNDFKLNQQSSWRNPKFEVTGYSYDKPEISNFSNFLFSKEDSLYVTRTGNKTAGKAYYSPTFNATSAATPYTAAMVADLMSYASFYKWHPEVVKALLLTTSDVPISNANHDSDRLNKYYGNGMPSFLAMKEGNRSRYWNGNNKDFYNSGNAIVFTEDNIKAGKRYRIAISWLSDGTFVRETGNLPQDITLYVYQGDKSWASGTKHNSFQMVEFKAETNEPLTIKIRRTANRGGRVLLGYNLHEVQ